MGISARHVRLDPDMLQFHVRHAPSGKRAYVQQKEAQMTCLPI